MKIVFFGTPDFAATILKQLLSSAHQVVAIVTNPDKPSKRGEVLFSPVKQLALQHNIDLFQPLRSIELVSFLPNYQADLFVVAAYGQILKQEVLDIPTQGSINVHASLLPKYRGAAPIQRALIASETKTGVCIMAMTAQMDAGDVIDRVVVDILPEETAGQLQDRLAVIGAQLLLDVVQQYEKHQVQFHPQEHALATYAPKITSQEGEVHWGLKAQKVLDHIRGCSPKPGAWCILFFGKETKRLMIKQASIVEHDSCHRPGSMLKSDQLEIACGQGSIRLLQVQLEGKKQMSDELFLRGYRGFTFKIS